MLQAKPAHSIDEIVAEIRASRDHINALRDRLKTLIRDFEEREREPRLVSEYWVVAAHTDALTRLRLFTEQNFIVVETVGLLAVTRYVFELTVWLKLMSSDPRYGLVYYHELCRKKLRDYEDVKNHLLREIALFERISAEENQRRADRLARNDHQTPEDVEPLIKDLQQISDAIDEEVDRSFTVYGDEARSNGYGYQAHLIRSQHLPLVEEGIDVITREFKMFETLPREVRDLFPKGRDEWKWRQKACLVAMQDEYDYLYTSASRLLHATPASLTTDQKNLEPAEMKVFLRYCRIRIRDIVEMATSILRRYSTGTVPN